MALPVWAEVRKALVRDPTSVMSFIPNPLRRDGAGRPSPVWRTRLPMDQDGPTRRLNLSVFMVTVDALRPAFPSAPLTVRPTVSQYRSEEHTSELQSHV